MSRASRLFIALLVLAALVPLSTPVSAQASYTWTTTADFDAGTYSQGEGFYEVSSSSCNPSLTSGQIELANARGEAFCIPSRSFNTFAWSNISFSQGSSTTNECGLIHTVSVGGSLWLNATTLGAGSAYACDAMTDGRVGLVGDVGLQVKIISSVSLNLYLINTHRWLATSTDGARYAISSTTHSAFTYLNNTFTQCGTNTVVSNRPLWIRLNRTGNNWFFYYSTDGLSFTLDEGPCVRAASGSMYAYILTERFSASAGTTTANIDDIIRTGTSDGFTQTHAASGSWLSEPFFVGPGDRVKNVTFGTSGVTATYAVDRVELWRSGRPVYVNETDITTNDSVLVPDMNIGDGAFVHLRFVLKGDGFGTPVIKDVTVNIEAIPFEAPSVEGSDWAVIVLLIFAIAALVLLGLFVEPFVLIGAGIAALVLGIYAFNVSANVLVAAPIFILGMMLVLMALIVEPRAARG